MEKGLKILPINSFITDPVYNEKYLKNKIKSYNGKTNTNFYNNQIPKEWFQCICLSINLINSVFRMGNNYYPQEFLEQCKYVVKEKKCQSMLLTTKNSDEKNSDEENSNEKNLK